MLYRSLKLKATVEHALQFQYHQFSVRCPVEYFLKPGHVVQNCPANDDVTRSSWHRCVWIEGAEVVVGLTRLQTWQGAIVDARDIEPPWTRLVVATHARQLCLPLDD